MLTKKHKRQERSPSDPKPKQPLRASRASDDLHTLPVLTTSETERDVAIEQHTNSYVVKPLDFERPLHYIQATPGTSRPVSYLTSL